MTDLVVSGLVKRRAALAGELEASQAKVRQLHADIAAVDAVIRQYDPAYPVDAIATKRPRPDAGTTEDMGAPCWTCCGARAGRRRSRRWRIVALRGLDAASGAVRAAVEGSAGRALLHQRDKGAVRSPAKAGRSALLDVGGRGAAGAPTRNGMVNAKRVYSVFMQNFRGHS